MDNKRVRVLGFDVFNSRLNNVELTGCKKVINTISPNSYGISTSDSDFKSALQHTDILVLDGVYFALASILLKGKNIKRNQGPDVFNHFMNELNKMQGKAFFLGSTEDTLKKIIQKTHFEYPNITVATYSPPFKLEFSDNDNQKMIEDINRFNPDVLFVGMTCPKQEKWSIKNKDSINATLIISIGNVFDWYAGNQKSIHPIWFKMRLGWFIRIIVRPEIFKRNIGNQMKFFWHLILIILGLKKEESRF